jgi:hypothetical protein
VSGPESKSQGGRRVRGRKEGRKEGRACHFLVSTLTMTRVGEVQQQNRGFFCTTARFVNMQTDL